MKYGLVFAVFVFVSHFFYGQDKEQGYKAFGVNPSVPDDSLFVNIKTAKNFDDTFKAIKQLIQFHDKRGNIDSVVFYGNILYDGALKENLQNKSFYLAKSSYIIANGKFEKGLYDEALKWYLKGVTFSEDTNNKVLLAENNIGLATTKIIRGNQEEGLILLNDCVERAPNEAVKNKAYQHLGNVMFNLGNFEASASYYKRANTYYKANELLKEELETDLFLGRLLERNQNIEEALATYTHVFNQALSKGFFMLYAKAGNDIGSLYLRQQDYENAKKILSTVYINAVQWGNLDIEKRVVFGLQKAYAQTGDYKNAYALMTQFTRVSNEILTNQNKQQVNELEIQYKTLEQGQEINRQKTIKGSLLIGFVIVLIPVLGLLYMYYQKLQTQSKLNKTQEEVNQQKIAALLKDQELKLVRASLDGQDAERKRIAKELHDSIGGNLATIKLQLSNKEGLESEQIIGQIDDTYNQVRELSHNLMPKKFEDNAFTSLLSDYVGNLQEHSKEKIVLHIYPEKDVNNLDNRLKVELFKIVQELLTNTLKHAKATQIDIQLSKLNNEIKLMFEDNGIGFNKEQVKYGLGFANIKDRLKSINGSMFIDTFPYKGTVIDIDVPLT
ncbi:MAG: ATP-binding protein [Aestuariibaculum sp.]